MTSRKEYSTNLIMNFDLLKIQHHIEETRLRLGKKLENFLLERLENLKKNLLNFLHKKSAAFFICSLTALSTILVDSTHDISTNFSYFLANFFHSNNITSALLFYYLSTILLLYFSAKILAKFQKNPVIINLIIFAIALGLFLPPLNITFDKIITFFDLKYFLFPIFLFIYLCWFLTKEIPFLFLAPILTNLTILLNPALGLNLLYISFLPSLFISLYLILKNNYIDFKKDLIFLLIILLIPSFDHQNIFATTLELPAFWWIFVLFYNYHYRFLSTIQLALLILCGMASLYAVIFYSNFTNLIWIIFTIIFSYFIKFSQNISNNKKFSRLYLAAILLVISHIISLFYQKISQVNSPNYVSNQIALITPNITIKKDVLFITNDAELAYPNSLYLNFNSKIIHNISEFKKEIFTAKNQLLFFKKSSTYCDVEFLELALRDQELRDFFLKNYHFLNRIIEIKNIEKNLNFFSDNQEFLNLPNSQFIKNDIEIYQQN